MKKIILSSLVLMFLCVLIACDDKHEHSYEAVVTEPTCEEVGYTTYTCTCNDSYVADEVASLGHTEVTDKAVSATCEEAGKTAGCHCSVCGKVLVAQEVIPANGHSWEEADYENPKTCSVCYKTEGEPLSVPPFEFPELAEFVTPDAYASTVKNKWEYQATVQGDTLYLYVIQYFGSESLSSDTVDLSLNHILFTTDIGEFLLCSNGAFDVENPVNISSVEFFVDTRNDEKTEYYLKVKNVNDFESDLTVNIYSFDNAKKNIYGNSDVYVYINNICYHTHFASKLYVGDKIKIKPESLYQTPFENQSPTPEIWGYDMQSAKEGIYIYVYQNVDQVVVKPGQDWTATHVEFSIFHHNFGIGAQNGYVAETYIAVWPTKTYFINSSANVLAVDVESTTFTNNRVEYRLFIRFNNNLENPQDGPYSFIKPRLFDPKDENKPYSATDVVEYRDNRFVHTIKGDSLFVYDNVTKIDNPYETNYLDSRKIIWNQNQFNSTKNMTLFIGDSFFESDNWWINFYNDYQNKACFTSAIGGTKVTQWLNWIPSLVDPFADNVENIVIHLGYNDVNATGITALQLEMHLEDLFARLHAAYPEANIYYFGIGTSYWFQYSNNTRAKETDNLTKAFAETCDYVTFIDMDSCYKAYMDETGGTLESFFKDGTHPKNENYKYLMAALEAAGCVIADKN